MYESFFQFKRKPFRLTPDSRFYFAAAPHNRAMAYLDYALEQGEGFLVLTGEPGTGKTTLLHTLQKHSRHHRCDICTLNANILNDQDFLQVLAHAMGLETPQHNKASLLEVLESHLLSLAQKHRRAVMFIDEAHLLNVESLETLRLLSNIQYNEQTLFQCCLIGQPALKETLQHPSLPQLRQRVVAACHLHPLSQEETRRYIQHRLRQAGHERPLFSNHACELIYRYCEGIPRRINQVCERALLLASLEQQRFIDERFIETVIRELCEELDAPAQLLGTLGQQELPFNKPEMQPLEADAFIEEVPEPTAVITVSLESAKQWRRSAPAITTAPEPPPRRQRWLALRQGSLALAERGVAASQQLWQTSQQRLLFLRQQYPLVQQHPRLLISAMSVLLIAAIALPLVPKKTAPPPSLETTELHAALDEGIGEAVLDEHLKFALEQAEQAIHPVPNTPAEHLPQPAEAPRNEPPPTPAAPSAKPPAKAAPTKTAPTTGPTALAAAASVPAPVATVAKPAPAAPAVEKATKVAHASPTTPATPPAASEVPLVAVKEMLPATSAPATKAPPLVAATAQPKTAPSPSVVATEETAAQPVMDTQRLNGILQQFIQAYRDGDIQALEAVMHPRIQSNDGSNLKRVSEEYAQLFRITQQRQLNFEQMQWQLEDSRARGSGQFQATITERGREHSRGFNGTIDLVIDMAEAQPRITEIYYSYAN